MFVFALYIEDEVQFDLTNVNIIRGNAQTLILNRERKKKLRNLGFRSMLENLTR